MQNKKYSHYFKFWASVSKFGLELSLFSANKGFSIRPGNIIQI